MAAQSCDLTVVEAAAQVAKGELSPVELVRSCLERIDELEAKIQAWALVDRSGAMAEARRCEAEVASGQRRGPLHGIPVGLKDIIFTSGLPTEGGSRAWAGFVPSYDASTVVKLKEAGAIILGKLHTAELAGYDPPPTRNPWNTAHTPGGSSSGSGAAVAARMCLAALGTQTSGSALRPAAYNGVVGLKAQHGRISAHGVIPVSPMMDHVCIIARTVEDAALVLQVAAGYDPLDHYSLAEPVLEYHAGLESQRIPPRLGLVREFFFERVDEEMRRHVQEAVGLLCRAGAVVDEVKLPATFDKIPDTHRTITLVDRASYHQEAFVQCKDKFGPHLQAMIEVGLTIPAIHYSRAFYNRLQHRLEVEPLMRQWDALLTPGAPGVAPRDPTTTGDPIIQLPWTHLGMPAVSLPCGLGRSGLPLAIQLVGAPFAEERLLAVARWCERTLGVELIPSVVHQGG